MSERDYAYWLGGMFELCDPEFLTARQVAELKNHLELVKKNQSNNTYCSYQGGQEIKTYPIFPENQKRGFFGTVPTTC